MREPETVGGDCCQGRGLERERERNRLRQRPLGVTTLAALLGLYIVAVAVIAANRWVHWDYVRHWADDDLFDFTLDSFVWGPISAVWAAVLCYGLWNLREWSRHCVSASGAMASVRRIYAAAVAPIWVRGFRGSRVEAAVLAEAAALLLLAVYFQMPSVAAVFRTSPRSSDTA